MKDYGLDFKQYLNGYMNFLKNSKTTRECITNIEKYIKENGYKNFSSNHSYSKDDKFFFSIENRGIFTAKIGDLSKPSIKIIVAHVDSPCLDIAQQYIRKTESFVYIKTHYYGSIKKYQWLTIPLAMHGTLIDKNNNLTKFSIGEKETESVFSISDIAPHLSWIQNKKMIGDIDSGILNPIIAVDNNDNVLLKYLEDKYYIDKCSLNSAEIQFVPAVKPRLIGVDDNLIGGYGQDDKACVYAALMASINSCDTNNTIISIFVDKEETGSYGVAGGKSKLIECFLNEILRILNIKFIDIYKCSNAISADVFAAYDPTYSELYDTDNSFYINKGCCISKFNGGGGKFGITESSISLMNKLIKICDANDIKWQTGNMGKMDIGGGGSVTKFISNLGIDTIEIGVPLLSMHSPFEVSSKNDLYNMYKLFFEYYCE